MTINTHAVGSRPDAYIASIGGGVFGILYITFVICITIYVLVLLHRFVTSHQRIASALERIAGEQSRRSP